MRDRHCNNNASMREVNARHFRRACDTTSNPSNKYTTAPSRRTLRHARSAHAHAHTRGGVVLDGPIADHLLRGMPAISSPYVLLREEAELAQRSEIAQFFAYVRAGRDQSVQRTLQAHPSFASIRSPTTLETALHVVARSATQATESYYDIINMLLQNGADVRALTPDLLRAVDMLPPPPFPPDPNYEAIRCMLVTGVHPHNSARPTTQDAAASSQDAQANIFTSEVQVHRGRSYIAFRFNDARRLRNEYVDKNKAKNPNAIDQTYDVNDTIYFSSEPAPEMLIKKGTWLKLCNDVKLHPSGFGIETQDYIEDPEWVVVKKFPFDMKFVPMYPHAKIGMFLPVGTYSLQPDFEAVVDDNLSYLQNAHVRECVPRIIGLRTQKLRYEFDDIDIHVLKRDNFWIPMISSTYFVQDFDILSGEEKVKLRRLIDRLHTECNLISLSCHGLHHAFVFYGQRFTLSSLYETMSTAKFHNFKSSSNSAIMRDILVEATLQTKRAEFDLWWNRVDSAYMEHTPAVSELAPPPPPSQPNLTGALNRMSM